MTCALLAVVIAPVRAQNKTAWVDSADHSTQLPVKWVSSVLRQHYDTLQPESVSDVCDLNLLTGRLEKRMAKHASLA